MIETDILIVGGGPAGATVAKYLAQANIDNILIQKKFDFKKPCGGGIRIDAFDEFELDKKQIKKYVNNIVLVFNQQKIKVDIKDTPLGIVERREFDSYLRDEAKDAGSRLYEARLLDLKVYDDKIISKVRFNDEVKEIKSNYVVAADGVNSSIRKKINGDRVSSLVTSYSDLTTVKSDDCEFHFGSNVADRYYAWAFPEENGLNIGTLADKDSSFMKNFMNFLNVKEKSKVYGYKIPDFDNNIFYKDRVFFVGDSASQVLPFTYEGIYYAMGSAKVLAGVLSANKEPKMYEKEWNKKYFKKFSTLRKLQKIFLYNDFMISIMMKLYNFDSIQKQMIELWLKDKEVKVDFRFFVKVFRKIVLKR
jgi:geranylgeranyl reductase